MEVNPSVPARSVPEFTAYATANPGKISFASSGTGTPLHVAGELFKMMTGIDMVHIPYRGSAPAVSGLIAGQVQVSFMDLPSSIEYVRAGKLRALAVATASARIMPEIPTVSDFVAGFEASVWFGIGAPRNIHVEVVNKLNEEINAALNGPRIMASIADLGAVPLGPITSAPLSSPKLKNGARSSERRTSNRSNVARYSINFIQWKPRHPNSSG